MSHKIRIPVFAAAFLILIAAAAAQYTPWLYWTFLPQDQMDEIVGETSGESAWKTIAEINAFNRERLDEEYDGYFFETQVIIRKLKSYGLSDVEVAVFPGGPSWRPLRGDLREVSPARRKIASINDELSQLAAWSSNTDATAELVWVGRGTKAEIEAAGVEGKIVVTEGSLPGVHAEACLRQGAVGVVAISMTRATFDPVHQIPWSGIRGWRDTSTETPKFGFYLNFREGSILKARLLGGEKIVAHAQIEAETKTVDLENVVCRIPGTDPEAGEIIFSAHLFEGYQKQGANDNVSGSAAILECARVLHTLIEEGRIPRPRRSIRFIWGPEFSGIGRWVQANKDLMDKTLCNINMDMVGEWLSKNNSFFCLMRTTYGNPHYINDVMENVYRYVGEGNRERIQNRSTPDRVPRRIVAPFGADEPFHYSIETHYGASDHMVFNDWAVRVPGIMMIAWPDQWYHMSGDLADKSDPTQLRRVAVIGAAGAYIVASADDAMAARIAGETASNAARRLGHQLMVAMETLNSADKANLAEADKAARSRIRAAVMNEKDTLDTILELAQDKKSVGAVIDRMKKTVDALGQAHADALQAHMEALARNRGVAPVRPVMTDLEKKAANIVPRPTPKVAAEGYAEYRKYINQVSKEIRDKYPIMGRSDLSLANTFELQLLIDGRRSVLDIKHMLDAQYERPSTLSAIFNYLEILKAAGLIE